MTARLKALVWILAAVCAVYIGFQLVPVWYANYQFQNDIEQVALVESYASRSEAEIQESVAARARTYGIPINAEQVRVQRDGSQLMIWTEYTVHIDLPVYPFDVKFRPSTKNRRI